MKPAAENVLQRACTRYVFCSENMLSNVACYSDQSDKVGLMLKIGIEREAIGKMVRDSGFGVWYGTCNREG